MGGIGTALLIHAAAPSARSWVAVVALVAAMLPKRAAPNPPSFGSKMRTVTLLLTARPCLLPQLAASAVQTQLLVRLGCKSDQRHHRGCDLYIFPFFWSLPLCLNSGLFVSWARLSPKSWAWDSCNTVTLRIWWMVFFIIYSLSFLWHFHYSLRSGTKPEEQNCSREDQKSLCRCPTLSP